MNKLPNIPSFLLRTPFIVLSDKMTGTGKKISVNREYKCRFEQRDFLKRDNNGFEIKSKGLAFIQGNVLVNQDDRVDIDGTTWTVVDIQIQRNPDNSIHHTEIYVI